MKFIPVIENQIMSDEELKQELNDSVILGKVRFGKSCILYKKMFQTLYIKYESIHRAFRRIKAVPLKMCCGRGELQLEYLVLCDKKGELAEFDLPDKKAAEAAIAELTARNPEIKIGVKK